MKNKFRLIAGSLIVAIILTVGITSAVFADPGDENGSFGPGYCQSRCLGAGNGGFEIGPRSGGGSCH
jgi:hypothetical protein